MAEILSGLRVSESSVFKNFLAPLNFIWSPGSGDAWLLAHRWPRFFWVLVLQRTQLSTFFFPRSAWISIACPPGSDDWDSLRISKVWKSQFSTSPAHLFQEFFYLGHMIGWCMSFYISKIPSYIFSSEVRRSSARMSHHYMPFRLRGHTSAVWSNPLFASHFSWCWHITPQRNHGFDCVTTLGN